MLFKVCSWADISRLTLGDLFRHRRRSKRRLSIRGTFDVGIRLLVTLVEIGILLLAMPRTLPVLSRDVGFTSLFFSTNETKVRQYNPGSTASLRQMRPCRTDPISYAGFNPAAVRYICVTTLVLHGHLRKKALTDKAQLSAISPLFSNQNVTIFFQDSATFDSL